MAPPYNGPTDPNPQATLTINPSQLRDGNDEVAPSVGGYYNVTTVQGTGTYVVKTSAGFLYNMTLNNNTNASTITIYDNTAASGTVIGTVSIPSGAAPVTLFYSVMFMTGLTIKIATGAIDVSVNYH